MNRFSKFQRAAINHGVAEASGKLTNPQQHQASRVAVTDRLMGQDPTVRQSQVIYNDPGTNAGPGLIGTGAGGTVGPVRPTAAQVDPIHASLRELDGILANRNKEAQDEFDQVMAGYREQNAADLAAKNKNVFRNESNYTGGNHTALLNAANAGSGLRGVLASLGALSGSGQDVLQRLVGLAANQDAGGVRDNFEANAEQITTAWGQAEREQRQRENDAQATLANTRRNNEAQILNSRQGLYQDLANMYGDDFAEGKDYASKASALAAPIARTTKASVAPYAKASSTFSPGAMQEYLAGTQNLNASAANQSMTAANSPVYNGGRRDDRLAGVA